MKISIAWVFDHIDVDWKTIDITYLISQFNHKVAEIEHYKKVTLSLDDMTLCQVTNRVDNNITAFSAEWAQEFILPMRQDAHKGLFFLVKKDKDVSRWATIIDFQGTKEGLLPALYCPQESQQGAWKNTIETEDVIFDVDNKSITNRPDLWGHRGMAREIAALLDVPLKDFDQFLAEKNKATYVDCSPITPENPFGIKITIPDVCKRFAGLYIENSEQRPSLLSMAHRLARVDSRPINALIDMTNYVMFDIGQPMHVFDANKLYKNCSGMIQVRRGHAQEKLLLLDGAEITLTPDDIVIANDTQALSLAGIMGGASSAITEDTQALFIESAHFDPTVIRLSSARHKQRTEASSRFEKTLDPAQNINALLRYIKLLDNENFAYTCTGSIESVGHSVSTVRIAIAHELLEQRLGIALHYSRVVSILEKLEFVVSYDHGTYQITVPTFRSSKDIKIKEDIIEEIGRYVGYQEIIPVLPTKQTTATDMSWVLRLRAIKRCMAYTLLMREASNYAFYDQDWLRILQWESDSTLTVQSPMSENWQSLVTSLVPHLLKNIHENSADNHQLRFFEWARIWDRSGDRVTEKKSLAAVFYDAHNQIDFYEIKKLLQPLFDLLKLDVSWKKPQDIVYPKLYSWYAPYQTADIMHQGKIIGRMGKVDSLCMKNVAQGDLCIVELDGDYLLHYKPDIVIYHAGSKYPDISRDISMFVPLEVTADQISKKIQESDVRIIATTLVDFFQKDEWKDRKSITMRYIIRDYTKTLTKEEADQVGVHVHQELESLGAQIR